MRMMRFYVFKCRSFALFFIKTKNKRTDLPVKELYGDDLRGNDNNRQILGKIYKFPIYAKIIIKADERTICEKEEKTEKFVFGIPSNNKIIIISMILIAHRNPK